MQSILPRRSYDYRIREAICESGDPDLFPELNIPSSTIRSWFHRDVPDVVTSELVDCGQAQFLIENRELRRRVALLGADSRSSGRIASSGEDTVRFRTNS